MFSCTFTYLALFSSHSPLQQELHFLRAVKSASGLLKALCMYRVCNYFLQISIQRKQWEKKVTNNFSRLFFTWEIVWTLQTVSCAFLLKALLFEYKVFFVCWKRNYFSLALLKLSFIILSFQKQSSWLSALKFFLSIIQLPLVLSSDQVCQFEFVITPELNMRLLA